MQYRTILIPALLAGMFMGCGNGHKIQHIARGYGRGMFVDNSSQPPHAYTYHTTSGISQLDTLCIGFPTSTDTIVLSNLPNDSLGTITRMWGLGAEHNAIFKQIEKDFEKQNSEGS